MVEKGQKAEAGLEQEYHFVIERMTFRYVDKVPGEVQYSSREVGYPFMTIALDWPGQLKVVVDEDGDPLREAMISLQRYLKELGLVIGREVLIEIAESRLLPEEMRGVDINSL